MIFFFLVLWFLLFFGHFLIQFLFSRIYLLLFHNEKPYFASKSGEFSRLYCYKPRNSLKISELTSYLLNSKLFTTINLAGLWSAFGLFQMRKIIEKKSCNWFWFWELKISVPPLPNSNKLYCYQYFPGLWSIPIEKTKFHRIKILTMKIEVIELLSMFIVH